MKTYRSLRGINSSGTLVGYYDEGDGNFHGFIGWQQGATARGDFDGDGLLTAADIDALTAVVVAQSHDQAFDLTTDGVVDEADHRTWVVDLKNTFFGDATLDGEFNSSDLVAVFQAGEYEDAVVLNSGWATGDWNGDREFGTADMVLAFQEGGFEQGPRAVVSAAAEPTGLALFFWAVVGLGIKPFGRARAWIAPRL